MSLNEEQIKTFSKEKISLFCPNLEKGIGRDILGMSSNGKE